MAPFLFEFVGELVLVVLAVLVAVVIVYLLLSMTSITSEHANLLLLHNISVA
jgi:hypothetical protein